MAKTIPGVPDKITREQLVEFLGNFGFKPEDLANLNVGPEGVTAVVFERDEAGARKIGPFGYVKHVIRIPVEN
ncbi:hypothetical protein D3C73_1554160 [compost metagenome]